MEPLYKYPRTYHLPRSGCLAGDDKIHPQMKLFDNETVIVTEKLDGENTTMYRDAIHARSVDSQNARHLSRDRVKALWGDIKYAISPGIRICGENMYAIHSIKYNDLESYFYVFSMWLNDYILSWDEMLDEINKIELNTGIRLSVVPLLYYGIYNKKKIHEIWLNYSEKLNRKSEGYVIRIDKKISYPPNFFMELVKYVRKNHIQTDENWLKNWTPDKINHLKRK